MSMSNTESTITDGHEVKVENFERNYVCSVCARPTGVVPAEVNERGWQWRPTGKDTAFAPPFGTIRACRACECLVAGGPTACVRCAEVGA